MIKDHDATVRKMAAEGRTVYEIGASLGVIGESVRFYCIKNDIPFVRKVRSGFRKGAVRLVEQSAEGESMRCMKRWGHDIAAHNAIKELCKKMEQDGVPRHQRPIVAFINHRTRAKKRGIEWRFTFAEWWKCWKDSGRFAERGPGSGYVMCRYGDVGPYSTDNCYIATGGENASHYFDHQRGDMHEFSTPRTTPTQCQHTDGHV